MKHTKSMTYSPSDEARELLLFAVNDGNLYRSSIQPAIANLRRKVAKGTYDSAKAADLFYYIATTASDMYNREFGYRFDVTARWTAAVDMVEFFAEDIEVDINGRFSRVSAGYDKTAPVLVGLLGNVWPHDLTAANIDYIKAFYGRTGWAHKLLTDWPDDIAPAYPAAKKNFVNGFVLIYR